MSLTRRTILRCISAATLAAALPAFGQSPKRPNILLIMADDMGFSDIGCYGSEIATPNLDALAKNGLRFTQFYNTARCCPTRASLLTGLYPHQAGIGHMVENRGHPSYQGYLNDSCVTIAEAIKPAGYRPLMVGKWHVGQKRPHWPLDRGFERYFGLTSGSSYFELSAGREFLEDNALINPMKDGWYTTDGFTSKAVDYIAQHAGRPEPFFLYLAYTAPHWPLHALPEDISKYKGRYMKGWDKLREERHARMIELGIIATDTPLSPRDPKIPAWESLTPQQKEAEDLKMAVYAAQIDRLDQGVGRVVSKLKETGQFDNTLILFLADNGGCAEEIQQKPGVAPGPRESFMSYGLPWANASNTPFRMYKHFVHEGGISSPLIAHWPGQIQPNTLTHQPGHVIDLLPTCLDAAGGEYPKTRNGKPVIPVEGKSLVPVLKGGQRPGHDAIYFEHEGNRAVRSGNWKIVSKAGQPWALHDISRDRTESTNLAAQKPDVLKELAAKYKSWADRCGVVPFGQLGKAKAQ